MKSTSVLVSLLLIICVTCSEGLTCYNCLYFANDPLSEPSCQTNPIPSTAKNCSSDHCITCPSVIEHVSAYATQSNNDTTRIYVTDAMEMKWNVTNGILMCSNFTGFVDDKPIVLRSCGYGISSINGTCTYDAFLTLNNRSATDVRACFCSNDKCNGFNSDPINPSGASCCHLTYYLLFTITIYSMFKYVSW